MTICSDCNEFLDIDWGSLNQEICRPKECEICRKPFETEEGYLPAYDIELDGKDFLATIIRKLQGISPPPNK